TVAAVGSELTASVNDPDGGVTGITWLWERHSLTPTPGWVTLPTGDDPTTYTPQRGDLGGRLRVRADPYTDGHGPGKSAQNTSVDRVVDVPDAPGDLSPSAGDGSVTLSWDGAVTNGAAIRRYEHRRRPNAQGEDQWTGWAEVPVEEDDHARDARSAVVSSLTNGTLYTFEVRAVNGVGPGVAADTTATPGCEC
ncbi:MAG: fibronectin type III domain-containing protein, partial [Gemmatimonadaceae bacterium]|nr:fibronectin type III domain-containing protein [Gemmatimonadaceae bacterium]